MKKLLASLALISAVLFLGGCDRSFKIGPGVTGDKNHKVLIVTIDKNPSGIAADDEYIRKALKNGGLICVNADTVQRIDPDWLNQYDTTNKEGRYLVFPMVLNWVSSKGWRLQTVFCINLNAMNKEYYFIK